MIYRSPVRKKIKAWKVRRNKRRIILLKDLQAGYLPIYKVASTSLRNLVCQHQAPRFFAHCLNTKEKSYKKQVERRIRKSAGIRDLQRLKGNYFLFAFVRNPITRLYSCYLDKVANADPQGRRFWMGRYDINPDMNFEAFAKQISRIPDSEADPHFRSQHHIIYHNDKCLVDFIGTFENLSRDWQYLAQKINFCGSPGRFRPTGAGNGIDRLPLSRNTAHIIARRYQEDIELLGYKREIKQWLKSKNTTAA